MRRLTEKGFIMQSHPISRHERSASRPPHKTSRGFTLVELLVVISIIALLIAILLPALDRAVKVAEATMCMSNQREIGRALLVYGEDWDGWAQANGIPSEHWGNDPGDPGNLNYPADHPQAGERLAPHWTVPLEELGYIQEGPRVNAHPNNAPGHNEIFACPSRPRVAKTSRGKRAVSGIQIVGERSVQALAEDQRTPYLRWDEFIPDEGTARIAAPRYVRVGYAPRPSEFPLIGDAWRNSPGGGTNLIHGYKDALSHPSARQGFFLSHLGSGGGAANVWFLDGHVDRLDAAGLAENNFWGAVNQNFAWINTCEFIDDPDCTEPYLPAD